MNTQTILKRSVIRFENESEIVGAIELSGTRVHAIERFLEDYQSSGERGNLPFNYCLDNFFQYLELNGIERGSDFKILHTPRPKQPELSLYF